MEYINKVINGDCLKVLKDIPDGVFDTVYTDPIWPNNSVPEFEGIDPYELFRSAAVHFPRIAKRVLIHVGLDSDPRLMSCISADLPFFRLVNLRYSRPHYKGRVLYDRDIVYVFGPPPASRPGNHILPGDFCYSQAGEDRYGHPCPRRLPMVSWLLGRYADGPVLDPFAGVCTTAVACIENHLDFTCIEINGDYCKTGNLRIERRREAGVQLNAEL